MMLHCIDPAVTDLLLTTNIGITESHIDPSPPHYRITHNIAPSVLIVHFVFSKTKTKLF